MKGFLYNAEGLSVPVEFVPGVPFHFECPEEECGKKVVIDGIVFEVEEDEFTKILKSTIENNPDFEKLRDIASRRYVFKGKINGKYVELPVESFEDFAKRFLNDVLILKG